MRACGFFDEEFAIDGVSDCTEGDGRSACCGSDWQTDVGYHVIKKKKQPEIGFRARDLKQTPAKFLARAICAVCLVK